MAGVGEGSAIGAGLAVVAVLVTAGAGGAAARAARREPVATRLGVSAGTRPVPRWFVGVAERWGLPGPVAWWWVGARAAGGVGLVLAAVVGPVAGAAVAGAAVAGAVALGSALRRRTVAAVDAQVPPLLEEVARAVRSGASLAPGLGIAGRRVGGTLGAEASALARRVERGGAVAHELARWREQRPHPALAQVVAALEVSALTGGSQAQVIDAIAATAREGQAQRAEVRALATQARTSAIVLVAAPAAFAVALAALDRRTGSFLFGSPAGLACVVAGAALDAGGAWWMHRLAARVS